MFQVIFNKSVVISAPYVNVISVITCMPYTSFSRGCEAALEHTCDRMYICVRLASNILICSHSQTPQYYEATPLMKDTAAVNRIVLLQLTGASWLN